VASCRGALLFRVSFGIDAGNARGNKETMSTEPFDALLNRERTKRDFSEIIELAGPLLREKTSTA